MPTIFDHPTEHPLKKQPPYVQEIHTTPHPDDDAKESVNKLLHSHHQSMGLFAAFAKHPKGINFANQEPDEVILLFLRRHFITNIPWIFATFLLLILPPVFLFLLSFVPSLVIPSGLTLVLVAFYYLIVLSYANIIKA